MPKFRFKAEDFNWVTARLHLAPEGYDIVNQALAARANNLLSEYLQKVEQTIVCEACGANKSALLWRVEPVAPQEEQSSSEEAFPNEVRMKREV